MHFRIIDYRTKYINKQKALQLTQNNLKSQSKQQLINITHKMGNSCSSDCYYDCCDLNYNCATNYNNCYYFYYNYSWIYYSIGSIIFTIIFFVVLCLLCRRRRANVMLTQPMNPMVVNTTQVSAQAGYDSSRNMYGQQNRAYQQGYNMQQGYNQPPNPNMRPQNPPPNQQGYEMGEPVFLSNNNQPPKQ